MSCYIPVTADEKKEMLSVLGKNSVKELFDVIPEKVRMEGALNLPEPMAEPDLVKHMRGMASTNVNVNEYACFLGAGAYDHFIPSVVVHLASRPEFYTSYTPYQAEISQGTLQAIFEYQTMICELTGMDVSNASMYDGATALAEAAVMACQATGREEVLVAATVHPEYRQVLKTYAQFRNIRIVEIGYSDGRVDMGRLEEKISGDTAAVILQSPNFLGIIEDQHAPAALAHQKGALYIACVDPVSLGVLKPPAEAGADIVVGEGQALGNPLSFGGPYLGFFATVKGLLRKMPGRIAGETTDAHGKRGFVLTIQSREQHIRREKATSNICSNQALNALTAAIYLSTMGKKGLREVGELCLQKSHYAFDRLVASGQFEPAFKAPFFKEFAVKSKKPVRELNQKLLKQKIIGGLSLEKDYPEIAGGWLVAVTEKRSKEEIDLLAKVAGGSKV